MSKFIVLYNYNKYYNRIIKKLNTYAEYKALITPLGSTPAEYHGFELVSTNFNYQDGVFAKHVINTATMETFYQIGTNNRKESLSLVRFRNNKNTRRTV